jgi:kumamolisin
MTNENRVPLPGSERAAARDARPIGGLDAGQQIEVTVVLRRRAPAPAAADPDDVALVRETLTGMGMQVTSVDPPTRRMKVTATIAQLQDVFGAAMENVESTHPTTGARVTHRHRTGTLSVPASLNGVVQAVLGLDDRPQARSHIVFADPKAVTTSYTPVELGSIYRFPAGTDGSGQTIAIIELGGGFDNVDLDTYFAGLGIPTPSVTAVSVDGASNQPGQDPSGADGEVMLDIEVAGALAPQAKLLVYFAPNTDAGFLDAVADAAHATPTPAAISISWGASEDSWTPQARTALDDAIVDAVALGVTVTAAAGDSGSSDTPGGGTTAHVDFPASSPHALACGGTTLRADASSGAVSSETVWNNGAGGGATGGGVSDVFPLPQWQKAATRGTAQGRGVPDVAGDADPRTGYRVRVDGTDTVIGGTSAVAPLWAALACRLSQALGDNLGLLQPKLYAGAQPGQPSPGFRDITEGDNGAYQAGPGWDPCTGLGVPDGEALLAALGRPAPAAPTPAS